MPTVAQMWQAFEKLVLSPDTPPLQRRDMKRKFFAGAYTVLG